MTELELSTRVRINIPEAPGSRWNGKCGVIDRIYHTWQTPYPYRVTDPYARQVIGYFSAPELTPTSEGKPPVSDETRAIGRDLLLGHRKGNAR